MTDEAIREYAAARRFHSQTLARWLGWNPAASSALGRLAVALSIGENHLRDLMDWLEEIALRDGCAIETILAENNLTNIETDPRLARADKLKRLKEEVRRRRFPRLARTEDAVRASIAALKLQPGIKLYAPPGLEGGRLRVEFSASSAGEFKALCASLVEAAEKEAAGEIFALLRGASIPEAAVET